METDGDIRCEQGVPLGGTPGHRAVAGVAMAALLASLLACTAAAADSALEFAIKATFLYKFAPFVTWPDSVSQQGPFQICMAGNDEVTKLLPDAVAGQTIGGRPVQARQIGESENLDSCRVLYIGNSADAAEMLRAVRTKPILTVTEGESAPHGIIAFAVIDGHVRFEIDQSLAAEAHLSISSKLMSLAYNVISAPEMQQ